MHICHLSASSDFCHPLLSQTIPPILPGGELPEAYRPSEWLSQVIPKKSPYSPQMGDEVMFFKEGYQKYLEAVNSKKVYDAGPRCEPYEKYNLQVILVCHQTSLYSNVWCVEWLSSIFSFVL